MKKKKPQITFYYAFQVHFMFIFYAATDKNINDTKLNINDTKLNFQR